MKHLLATSCILLASVVTAAADSAADHAAAGKKAFAEGKYAEAITSFREAHKLAPDPKLLYAIAQAQRMAGDCASAVVTYEEFIKTNADKKLVEYSQENIKRCKEQLASQPKVEPPRPEPPPTEPPKTEPPRTEPPKTEPPRVEPKPARSSGETSWTTDWIGHGLVAAGVGAAVVGTLLWTQGRSDAAAVNDATDHDAFLAARDAAGSAVNRQRIGIALGIAGAGAIAGGVIHYRMAGKKEVGVGAAPTRGGGAFVARIRF
jgi:tetratricopeptide (TPR) repeat protein